MRRAASPARRVPQAGHARPADARGRARPCWPAQARMAATAEACILMQGLARRPPGTRTLACRRQPRLAARPGTCAFASRREIRQAARDAPNRRMPAHTPSQAGGGPALLRVVEVPELRGVAHEEGRRVVADLVVVALLRVELEGEAAHVAVRVRVALFAGHRRE